VKCERLGYTRHARWRMRKRNISEGDVLRVMNDPDLTYPSCGKQVAEDVFEAVRLLSQTDARIISAIDLEEAREVRQRS
jgi:hypothetical protein